MKYIETLRIEDGVVQNIEYHRRRMQHITAVQPPELQSLNTIKNGRVKCRIVYDESSIISVEFMPYRLPHIDSLKIIETTEVAYDRKYLDRGCLDALYLQREECDDILICRDGFISDTYFCNAIFERLDGELFTPNTPLLKGTKRQYLIDRGEVKECQITLDDIKNYRGVYLINAMIDIEDNIHIPIQNIRI